MSKEGTVADRYLAYMKLKLVLWARQMSSGDLTYRELRERNYPYASRHVGSGKAKGNFYLGQSRFINSHSGVFREGWQTENLGVGNGFELKNVAPYANLLFDGIPGLTIPRNLIGDSRSQREIEAIENKGMKVLVEDICESLREALSGS